MNNNKHLSNSETFSLLFLSLIAAFGPIVTDLYLPAMPQLSDAFKTTTSSVQLSLTVSFLGLGIGQLLFGPISDKYGRKFPLVFSLALFVFSTLGCIFSSNIESFIFFRLIQGFAGAGGIVISRSIAVDLYKSEALAKFLSLLAAIQGLAPIIAPLAGGMLMKFTNWKGIFTVLLVLGILILSISFLFKESLKKENRLQENVLQTFKHFTPILKNKKFVNYTLALSFTMAVFFGYISASPFIFQKVYQLSPMQFSIFFAINAIGFIVGSQLIRFFKSSQKALNIGTFGLVLFSSIQAILLVSNAHVYLIESLFFILIVFIGIIVPTATTLALELERKTAGNASAILGFTQFLFGAVASPLVGIGNVMTSTAIVLVSCSILCLLFIWKTNSQKNIS